MKIRHKSAKLLNNCFTNVNDSGDVFIPIILYINKTNKFHPQQQPFFLYENSS